MRWVKQMKARLKKPLYFRFWVNDWLGSQSVRVMTPYQRGCYFQLLCESWASDHPGFLPSKVALWQLAGAHSEDEFQSNGGELVLTKFKQNPKGIFFNSRLLSEFKYLRSFTKTQREKGLSGSEQRWHRHSPGNAPAMTPATPKNSHTDSYSYSYSDSNSDSDSPVLSFKKRKNQRKASARKPAPSFHLPAWIQQDSWAAYVEMRLRIRKPMTNRAMELACMTLERLKAQGQEPQAVLNQSILNSWQGLFPVRGNANPAPEFTEEEFEQMKAEIHEKQRG